MSKFTYDERSLVKNLVANLTIRRIDDNDIIKVIYDQTGKTITRKEIWNIRERIKRDSFHWYKTMRDGEYEYVHEFKERINEILFLQKKHHEIVIRNEHNPQVQQNSLAELHRLSITLSNLYDVAPTIINGTIAVPTAPENKNGPTTNEFIV